MLLRLLNVICIVCASSMRNGLFVRVCVCLMIVSVRSVQTFVWKYWWQWFRTKDLLIYACGVNLCWFRNVSNAEVTGPLVDVRVLYETEERLCSIS